MNALINSFNQFIYSKVISNKNRLVALLFILFSSSYLYFGEQITLDLWSSEDVFNARSMPRLFGIFTLISACLLFVSADNSDQISGLKSLNWRALGIVLSAALTYGFLIESLGFLLSNSCFLFIGFYTLGARAYGLMVLAAIGLSLGFYAIMSLLDIYLSPLPVIFAGLYV